jgi:hypothetical protein
MVYIESLLPNPVGQDAGNEWIKIASDSSGVENIYGWRVEDSGGTAFYLSRLGTIKPDESIELKQTGISLNNNGDTIFLYDKNGVEVDRLGYSESVAEGEIVFSEKLLAEQPLSDSVALANITEAGVVNGSLGGSTLEPLLLGLVVATISTTAFIYLWKNIFCENE